MYERFALMKATITKTRKTSLDAANSSYKNLKKYMKFDNVMITVAITVTNFKFLVIEKANFNDLLRGTIPKLHQG